MDGIYSVYMCMYIGYRILSNIIGAAKNKYRSQRHLQLESKILEQIKGHQLERFWKFYQSQSIITNQYYLVVVNMSVAKTKKKNMVLVSLLFESFTVMLNHAGVAGTAAIGTNSRKTSKQ